MKPILAKLASRLPLILGCLLIGSKLGLGVGLGLYLISDPFFEVLVWPQIKKTLKKEWK